MFCGCSRPLSLLYRGARSLHPTLSNEDPPCASSSTLRQSSLVPVIFPKEDSGGGGGHVLASTMTGWDCRLCGESPSTKMSCQTRQMQGWGAAHFCCTKNKLGTQAHRSQAAHRLLIQLEPQPVLRPHFPVYSAGPLPPTLSTPHPRSQALGLLPLLFRAQKASLKVWLRYGD